MTREEKIAEVRAKLDAAYDALTEYRDAVMWTPDHQKLLGIVSEKLGAALQSAIDGRSPAPAATTATPAT